jgi:hypothetical protein
MKGLSSSQLKKLLSSRYVLKVTESQVIFSDVFKELMLAKPTNGLSRQEFFNTTLGVDCFDKKFVDSSLNRWRRRARIYGSVNSDKRGRSKNTAEMTVDEMKAEIAYQKEVIAHLKKIRGLTDEDL